MAIKKAAKTVKKLQIKPIIRVRVRCKEEHKNPWLRRLYVVWAAPPVPSEEGGAAPPPIFAIAQSDARGYLSPLKSDLDPKADGSLPLFPDHEYFFYFVRYPSSDVAEKMAQHLNGDLQAAKQKFGEPRKLAPVLEVTSKSKKGGAVKEAIIRVAEDPAWFYPQGSQFYGGWTLFRDMPGTGSNSLNSDIQCPPLQTQVRRLQFHLGSIRYPVGNQWHPYSPEPWENGKARKVFGEKLPVTRLYPNEGVFDILTWNCVLAFQRDARRGDAARLDSKKARTPVLAPGSFDPLPAAEDRRIEMNDSFGYVSSIDADIAEATAPIPADVDTIVDKTTGDAIRQWLTGGLRKPGKILICKGSWDSWMQQDAAKATDDLSDELRRLGFRSGLLFNNAVRDARVSVDQPGKGQIINSIHKSGFAFDMRMSKYVAPSKACPLYFVQDPSETKKTFWIVYAPVKKSDVPAGPHGDHVEYVESIAPWIYDSNSPSGGGHTAPLADGETLYLNFTKVCQKFGLKRIPAHLSGWQGGEVVKYTMDGPEDFSQLLGQLNDNLASEQFTTPVAIQIAGKPYKLADLTDMIAYWNLWFRATKGSNPTPEVVIEAGTKTGDAVERRLRGPQLAGRQVKITVEGEWAGGEGAAEVAKGAQTTATLTLGPKTEFPLKMKYTLCPVTEPVTVRSGDVIEAHRYGHPAHMEWWHFQYEAGYDGLLWREILGLIGWTPEGLLGKKGDLPIFGLYGLGYLPKHLNADAR